MLLVFHSGSGEVVSWLYCDLHHPYRVFLLLESTVEKLRFVARFRRGLIYVSWESLRQRVMRRRHPLIFILPRLNFYIISSRITKSSRIRLWWGCRWKVGRIWRLWDGLFRGMLAEQRLGKFQCQLLGLNILKDGLGYHKGYRSRWNRFQGLRECDYDFTLAKAEKMILCATASEVSCYVGLGSPFIVLSMSLKFLFGLWSSEWWTDCIGHRDYSTLKDHFSWNAA